MNLIFSTIIAESLRLYFRKILKKDDGFSSNRLQGKLDAIYFILTDSEPPRKIHESSTENIQMFVPKFRTSEILDQIKLCLDKGWTGMGYKTTEFENAWSEYTGLPYSHFLSSNTVGLHLALNILKSNYGWKDNDEIITTPLTFVSTNHSILYENLSPVFADVDESLCLDPISVEKSITNKTRAVIFVGIGGNVGKLNEISQLCKERNLQLILDAAHMAGTKIKNSGSSPIHVGKEADVTVFSFQAVKNTYCRFRNDMFFR